SLGLVRWRSRDHGLPDVCDHPLSLAAISQRISPFGRALIQSDLAIEAGLRSAQLQTGTPPPQTEMTFSVPNAARTCGRNWRKKAPPRTKPYSRGTGRKWCRRDARP